MPGLPTGVAPKFPQAFKLDGVPHRRARGVTLDEIRELVLPPRLGVGRLHRPELALFGGRQ